jgi:hypothetical protein
VERDYSAGAIVIAALWFGMYSAIVIATIGSPALQQTLEFASRY